MPICFRKATPDMSLEGLCVPLDEASAEALDGIEIFRNLAPDTLASLSRRCVWRRYRPGQLILPRHDESRDVFFVVSGRVSAICHFASVRDVRFLDAVVGDIFGDFAAIDGQLRSADIVSVTTSLVGRMSAELFWDVMRRHESVWTAMLCRLTRIARGEVQRLAEPDAPTMWDRG